MTNFKETKDCGNPDCNNKITDLKINNRKYCSRSCAVTVNNKGRKLTSTKIIPCARCNEKIEVDSRASSKTLCKECKVVRNRERVRKWYTGKKDRRCKRCGNKDLDGLKQYCSQCQYDYYEVYRPRCEFKFDPMSYPEWFDCTLIEKYGKYSPVNKGNNLNGVSMDHMISVRYGFQNGISPKILSHPANCKLMIHSKNSSKKTDCSITLEELEERIKEFDEKYKSPFLDAGLQNQ